MLLSANERTHIASENEAFYTAFANNFECNPIVAGMLTGFSSRQQTGRSREFSPDEVYFRRSLGVLDHPVPRGLPAELQEVKAHCDVVKLAHDLDNLIVRKNQVLPDVMALYTKSFDHLFRRGHDFFRQPTEYVVLDLHFLSRSC